MELEWHPRRGEGSMHLPVWSRGHRGWCTRSAQPHSLQLLTTQHQHQSAWQALELSKHPCPVLLPSSLSSLGSRWSLDLKRCSNDSTSAIAWTLESWRSCPFRHRNPNFTVKVSKMVSRGSTQKTRGSGCLPTNMEMFQVAATNAAKPVHAGSQP